MALYLGEGNRILDSHLHHNRGGGIFVAFQQNFEAKGNTLARNGHEADGGTGYGIALIGGTYNDGITITGNTTDHNYRKGIDVHDGNNMLIEDNILSGDRLYGIAAVARTFAMRNVVIRDNDITFDPAFHAFTDDDTPDNAGYNDYLGIELQTNYEGSNHASRENAAFTISGNTLRGLNDYSADPGSTISAIRFGHHENDQMPYTLNMRNNTASGNSADNFIHIRNQSTAPGDITLMDNHATFSGTARGIILEGISNGSRISAQNNTLNGENISPPSTMKKIMEPSTAQPQDDTALHIDTTTDEPARDADGVYTQGENTYTISTMDNADADRIILQTKRNAPAITETNPAENNNIALTELLYGEWQNEWLTAPSQAPTASCNRLSPSITPPDSADNAAGETAATKLGNGAQPGIDDFAIYQGLII